MGGNTQWGAVRRALTRGSQRSGRPHKPRPNSPRRHSSSLESPLISPRDSHAPKHTHATQRGVSGIEEMRGQRRHKTKHTRASYNTPRIRRMPRHHSPRALPRPRRARRHRRPQGALRRWKSSPPPQAAPPTPPLRRAMPRGATLRALPTHAPNCAEKANKFFPLPTIHFGCVRYVASVVVRRCFGLRRLPVAWRCLRP